MTDLEALRALVRMLREEGAANYEGPIPDLETQLPPVKLAVRPPAPPPPERPEPKRTEGDEMPRPRIPAGLGGLIHG